MYYIFVGSPNLCKSFIIDDTICVDKDSKGARGGPGLISVNKLIATFIVDTQFPVNIIIIFVHKIFFLN